LPSQCVLGVARCLSSEIRTEKEKKRGVRIVDLGDPLFESIPWLCASERPVTRQEPFSARAGCNRATLSILVIVPFYLCLVLFLMDATLRALRVLFPKISFMISAPPNRYVRHASFGVDS